MSTSESTGSKIDWLRRKINYGATLKGMITFTIVFELVIVLFLSTFSQPIEQILGTTLLPMNLTPEGKAARLVMLYHALTIPFLAICTYVVLLVMDVREKFKSRVKWPLFIGSILSSLMGVSYAYVFEDAWIVHGLMLVGMSLCFYAGILLLLGIFPTKSFPERNSENSRNVLVAQIALTVTAICVLISVILGASVGAFFGTPDLTAMLAEYFLREPYPDLTIAHLFINAIKGHLHIMLLLIDVIILLVVYRYTVPDQKGRWYLLSMALIIPGALVASMGSWFVTFKDIEAWTNITGGFDMHYLIYFGAAILLLVGLILTITGWGKTSKAVLGNDYASASWVTRAKAVFKRPVPFAMYFQFTWVNFVMTFGGIFLALSLRPDSVLAEKVLKNIPSFREGPLAVETTVARGHWHILGVLLLFMVQLLDIKGKSRTYIGWSSFIGSILAFGLGVIYLYFPHLDTSWISDGNPYATVVEFWKATAGWLPWVMDIGIVFVSVGIILFCIHQFLEIWKGRKDVESWPE
ncbi:MAG: hypothetical protein ACXADW_24255 [Candidatus Hodarchaeales archaeon]|jgi:hypothetical protein